MSDKALIQANIATAIHGLKHSNHKREPNKKRTKAAQYSSVLTLFMTKSFIKPNKSHVEVSQDLTLPHSPTDFVFFFTTFFFFMMLSPFT